MGTGLGAPEFRFAQLLASSTMRIPSESRLGSSALTWPYRRRDATGATQSALATRSRSTTGREHRPARSWQPGSCSTRPDEARSSPWATGDARCSGPRPPAPLQAATKPQRRYKRTPARRSRAGRTRREAPCSAARLRVFRADLKVREIWCPRRTSSACEGGHAEGWRRRLSARPSVRLARQVAAAWVDM